MSHNFLPVGTCRELWLMIPSLWLQLLTNEVEAFASSHYNASIILLYTVYVTEAPPVSQRASQYQGVTVKCWHVTGQLREALVSCVNVLS